MSAAARHRPGVSRLLAAVLGAPLAALLVSLALPAVVPASSDVRYLAACIVVIPLMAAAPCAVLLARSTARAWGGIALASTAALVVLWRAFT
ncbi:hypothetical protein LZ198_03400 [Myxococcus sp. K15C18031901]|uniref:hypothetical protein n=1 Tax=Myxococcus dinghuensis TaxID=2906761 RepID=UPI0020A78976|nr:hypothetical protein [Myxococcus dinghuensis]MCP3097918.1 hypothetical protein [Myxococcus dinghuensis]